MKSKSINEALTISQSDAEQLRTTLSECIAEIDRLREIMKEDDIRIANSQARTYAIMAEMDAMAKPRKQKVA